MKVRDMSFKLGMPTLIEFNSIEENINLCSSLGLDFIELNMNLHYCMPENNKISNLKKIIEVTNGVLRDYSYNVHANNFEDRVVYSLLNNTKD